MLYYIEIEEYRLLKRRGSCKSQTIDGPLIQENCGIADLLDRRKDLDLAQFEPKIEEYADESY